MNSSIVPGSLSALAQQAGKSIAETFISCDAIIIIDTSGSMGTTDSRGGLSRYDIACEELVSLQRHMPGKIAIVNFSSKVQFEPGGIPTFLNSGTDMAAALNFVKIADKIDGMRFVLISDGQPDSPNDAINSARAFKNKIDVIYVGPEDRPAGRDFLMKLASVTGGKSITVDRAKELQTGIQHLLAAG